MAEKTERERVIQHFVDSDLHLDSTVDLAIELQRDKQGRQSLINEKAYVDRALTAGYKSKAMSDLLSEIQAAKTAQNEPEQEPETAEPVPVNNDTFDLEKE